MSVVKAPLIPGFTALSDQIFVRRPDDDAEPPPATHPKTDPKTVIIYGWGDGLPKHVAKFADGYRALYPGARQIVVLSPIRKAVFSTLAQRTTSMMPIVKEVFPSAPADDASDRADQSVLIHLLSNAGGINTAATLNAYRSLYGKPLPHQLLVMDSTPGGTKFTWGNLVRWSRAMALGLARLFPWPFVFTQSLCAIFVCFNRIVELLSMRESAGSWSRNAMKNPSLKDKGSKNLYIYSKADALINWEDIQQHAVETQSLGWKADTEIFEGSAHVSHMRASPERYWATIAGSWQRAIEQEA